MSLFVCGGIRIAFIFFLFSVLEMDDAHVYRKYSPGEPSTRLYVKNLAKQVEVKVQHMCYIW